MGIVCRKVGNSLTFLKALKGRGNLVTEVFCTVSSRTCISGLFDLFNPTRLKLTESHKKKGCKSGLLSYSYLLSYYEFCALIFNDCKVGSALAWEVKF